MFRCGCQCMYVCMSKKGEIIVRFHCGTILKLEQIELLQLSLRVVYTRCCVIRMLSLHIFV